MSNKMIPYHTIPPRSLADRIGLNKNNKNKLVLQYMALIPIIQYINYISYLLIQSITCNRNVCVITNNIVVMTLLYGYIKDHCETKLD